MDTSPPSSAVRLYISGAARAIEALGDAWVLRLLRTSFRGAKRFSDFMHALDISRAVLTERLERMVRAGVMVKLEAPGTHPEYRLTERGLDVWRVLIAMWQWERSWGTGVETQANDSDRPRGELVHLECGHVIDPVCACAHCREAISPFDTYASLRPGAVEESKTGDISTRWPESEFPRKRFRQSHSDARERLPTLMRLYGDRWNAAIMAAALTGQTTFSEFEAATGIWPGPLSARLEELQALRMLKPRQYAGSRHEYRMTRASLATFPITLELLQWGDRWLWQNQGPLIVMHRPCGHPVSTLWLCPVCHASLERKAVRFQGATRHPDGASPSRSRNGLQNPDGMRRR